MDIIEIKENEEITTVDLTLQRSEYDYSCSRKDTLKPVTSGCEFLNH